MRHIDKLITALLALALPFAARAECDSVSCTALVDQVYVEANSGLWLQTSGNETLLGCVPDSNVFIRLAGNSTNFKEVYSLLLTRPGHGLAGARRHHSKLESLRDHVRNHEPAVAAENNCRRLHALIEEQAGPSV